MSQYIDGFVIPVAKDKIETYREVSQKACAVWMECGALEYRECVAEDTNAHDMLPFPKLAGAKEDETVVFAWILYKSREHRDEVNAKVMEDPRMKEMMVDNACPFDSTRMAYGGFTTIVKD